MGKRLLPYPLPSLPNFLLQLIHPTTTIPLHPKGSPLNNNDKKLELTIIVMRIFKRSLWKGLRTYLIVFGLHGVHRLFLMAMTWIRGNPRNTMRNFLISPSVHRTSLTSASFSLIWYHLSNLISITSNLNHFTTGFIAGTTAGLSIFLEKPRKRFDYSLAIIFRALQGGMNTIQLNWGFKIPYGGLLFLTLSGSQYMYTHFFYPKFISPSDNKFLNKLLGIPHAKLEVNRDLVAGRVASPNEMWKILSDDHSDPRNSDLIANLTHVPSVVPCKAFHMSYHTCTEAVVQRAIAVFKILFPMYAYMNLGTKLLFGGTKIFKSPHRELYRLLIKTVNSGMAMSFFYGINQFMLCRIHALHPTLPHPILYRPLYYLSLLTSFFLSYWWDSPQRNAALSYFMAPRALYGAYKITDLSRSFPRLPHFESYLFAISSGLIMACFQDRPTTLDPLLVRILSFLLGIRPNPPPPLTPSRPTPDLDQTTTTSPPTPTPSTLPPN